MKYTITHAVALAFIGYALLALSAVAVTLVVGLVTGYFPCVTCFTLPLLTFRLTEIHWTLMLFPPLAAACVLVLLSRTRVNRTIAAGQGLTSPYLLVSLVYVLLGAREFPLEVATLWMVWAFLMGVALSIAAEMAAQTLRQAHRTPRS